MTTIYKSIIADLTNPNNQRVKALEDIKLLAASSSNTGLAQDFFNKVSRLDKILKVISCFNPVNKQSENRLIRFTQKALILFEDCLNYAVNLLPYQPEQTETIEQWLAKIQVEVAQEVA